MRRLVESGFDGASATDQLYLVTLTAPGLEATKHGADAVDSEVKSWWWNNHAPQGWSWWVTDVRRELPESAAIEFVAVWEVQQRGVLHRHAIVRLSGAVSERAFRSAVRVATERVYSVDGGVFGWGSQRKVDRIVSGKQAGYYVAKYVTKGGERATLLDVSSGELKQAGKGYRTWSASAHWGDRMCAIREQQRQWAASQRAGASPPGGGPPAVAAAGAAAGSALDLYRESYASESDLMIALNEILGASAV